MNQSLIKPLRIRKGSMLLGFFKLLIFMCLRLCLCTTCVPGAEGDQKRAEDHLELELWLVWLATL